MKSTYILKIDCEKDVQESISSLLGIGCGEHPPRRGWSYEVVEYENDPYFDFIDVFFGYLKGKEENLLELGVTPSDITFWILYEYDGQCNMEFWPDDLLKLGEAGITLCISCYDTGEGDSDYIIVP